MDDFEADQHAMSPRFSRLSADHEGFSLVEVTIAIGLFAFVIVGIMGLFPAALRQRADAALETRGVLVAQQVFGGILAANSVTNAVSSDYSIKWDVPPGDRSNPSLRDLRSGVVLGFSENGTSVNHIFGSTNDWRNVDVGPPEQKITAKALVVASNIAPRLYSVRVDFGYPANLPADKRRVQSFTALFNSP
jgi:Tfp pilus assembly protein PilV